MYGMNPLPPTNYPSKLACCRTLSFGPILQYFPSSLLFYLWIHPQGVCDLDQTLPCHLQFTQFNLRDHLYSTDPLRFVSINHRSHFSGHFFLLVLLVLFELTLVLCYGIRSIHLQGTFYSSGYPSNIVCQEMKLTNLILQ